MEYRVEEVSQFKGETLRVDFDCREPIFINSSVVSSLGKTSNKPFPETTSAARASGRSIFSTSGITAMSRCLKSSKTTIPRIYATR